MSHLPKKVLFIDRDGTIVLEPKEDLQLDSFAKLEFYPQVFTYLGKIVKEADFELVMVTNQDGMGTDCFPENTFWPVHNFVQKAFKNEGIEFAAEHIDDSFPHENKPTRKPGIAMLSKYFSEAYDLKNSFVIGDRLTDIELAKNLGCKGIFIKNNKGLGNAELITKKEALKEYIALETQSWEEIYSFLCLPKRKAKVERRTKETDIKIDLNIDGTGKSEIKTGLHFFDHMLDQLAKHSGIDLQISVIGDLEVDEHHTIEDTAIALGECFLEALKDKRGMMRYGFTLPMDDCLAQVAIDFGGRPWLVWEAAYKREKIGDMPTEMFYHFFKSFTDAAKCNLNIKVEGENEHHKIESTFKAWAKAIKMAVKLDKDNMQLPSTKGVL
jgi:imidazoleglycerol-phosphate dehydratase / histidinol-phosphatase